MFCYTTGLGAEVIDVNQLLESRDRLLKVIYQARDRIFDQDQTIQELEYDLATAQKTIGQLRSELVYLKMRKTMIDPGKVAYDAYFNHSQGKSLVSDAPLPTWEQQSKEICDAWRASAEAVMIHCDEVEPYETEPCIGGDPAEQS